MMAALTRKTEAPSLTWLCGFVGACHDCDFRVEHVGGQREALKLLAEHGRAHHHLKLFITTRVHVPGLHGSGDDDPTDSPNNDHDVDDAVREAAKWAAGHYAAEEASRLEAYAIRGAMIVARDTLIGDLVARPRCPFEQKATAGSSYVCGYTHCLHCSAHTAWTGGRENGYWSATCRCNAGFSDFYNDQPGEIRPLPPLKTEVAEAPKSAKQTSLFGAPDPVAEPATDDVEDDEDLAVPGDDTTVSENGGEDE